MTWSGAGSIGEVGGRVTYVCPSGDDQVTVRLLAEPFVNDVSALIFDSRLDMQTACAHLVLTALQRRRRPESS